jgi:TatD DNase family protein
VRGAVTWVDTHAHLDDAARDGTLDAVLARADAAGVSRVVAVGGNPASNALAASLAAARPGRVFAAAGLDRDQAGAAPDVDALAGWWARPGVVAAGEMGLDYHYRPESAPEQRRLFERQFEAAMAAGKPAIVHSRGASADTLAIVSAVLARAARHPSLPGVLHCFTEAPDFARALLDLGFCIGFSGIVTFRNADALREIAARVPADRLLLETDTPYLSPVPLRGRTNEPAHLVHTAEVVARVRDVPLEELAASTRRNAARLFGWDGTPLAGTGR